jgi:hypothetical protein
MAVQPKGQNTEMEVVLDAKDDQKTVLGLSYYSNALMQQFILDCCIGYMLNRHFQTAKSQLVPIS